MKRTVKVLSLVLVLAMIVCAFSACKGEKTPEEKAIEAYNALKTDVEKLFYVSSVKHPSEGKTLSLSKTPAYSLADVGEGVGAIIDSGKTVEAEAKLTVDKFEVQGQDYLAQLGGGPLGLEGKLLANNKGTNLGLETAIAGLPLSVDVTATENAVFVKSPFAFKKPIYLSKEALEDVVLSLTEAKEEGDASNAVVSMLSSIINWAKENLTEETGKHLLVLIKDAIPASSISVENVAISDIKGDYINEDINAECVSLNLDAKALDKLLTNVNNNVLTDSVVKNLVVSLYNCLPDAVKSGIIRPDEGGEALDGEKLYNKLCDEFKKLINDFDAEKEKGSVVIKRYFVGGFSVKFGFEFSDEKGKVMDLSCWDWYKGEARQYGLKLHVKDGADIDLVGGANLSKASLNGDVDTYTVDVSIEEDGLAAPGTKLQSELNFNIERNGEETKVSYTMEAPEDSVVVSCNVAGKGNEMNGTASIKKGDEELADFVIKQTEEQGDVKLTCDAAIIEDGAEHKMKIVCDMKNQTLNGKEVLTVNWDMDFEDMFKFDGGITLTVDKDSQNTIQEFSEKDGFVINGRHDLPYLSITSRLYSVVLSVIFRVITADRTAAI